MRFPVVCTIISLWFQSTDEAYLITKLETCDNALIKVVATIKTIENRYQVVNANYSAPIMNGDNLRARLNAEYLVGNIWVPLFKFREENGICTWAEKYVGPLLTDILQAAAIIPRCPVAKGTFIWRNYKPNFDKMRLQLPSGQVRVKLEGIEKRSGKVGFCLDINMVAI